MQLGEDAPGARDRSPSQLCSIVCVAVHQHLRLDDRHEPRLLAERGVAGERVRVRPDAVLARDVARRSSRSRATWRSARRARGTPSSRSRSPSRPSVTVSPSAQRERLRARVDLDARDDPLRLEQLRERRPVGGALADRLVEEDHAADVLLDALGREEQLAVGAPVVLGRLDVDRVEALLDRAGRSRPRPGSPCPSATSAFAVSASSFIPCLRSVRWG